MAASYPTSVKSFSTKSTTDTVEAAHPNELQDEVTAIETALLTGGLAHDLLPDATANTRNLGSASKKWNDLHLNGEVYERGRTTGAGEWITPSFAAGNFTANGSMTWTVASGDVVTYAYMLVGKTMTLRVSLSSTTVGGSVNTELRVAIPGGFTSAAASNGMIFSYLDNGANEAIGVASVSAGGSVVTLTKGAGVGNWTLATDATAVRGVFMFEVA